MCLLLCTLKFRRVSVTPFGILPRTSDRCCRCSSHVLQKITSTAILAPSPSWKWGLPRAQQIGRVHVMFGRLCMFERTISFPLASIPYTNPEWQCTWHFQSSPTNPQCIFTATHPSWRLLLECTTLSRKAQSPQSLTSSHLLLQFFSPVVVEPSKDDTIWVIHSFDRTFGHPNIWQAGIHGAVPAGHTSSFVFSEPRAGWSQTSRCVLPVNPSFRVHTVLPLYPF